MEKEKVYTLVTVHVTYEKETSRIEAVLTEIYKDKEVAVLDAKANADADFYIAGDRDKCAFFEYNEKDAIGIFNAIGERQQIYGNKIERLVNENNIIKLCHTWRLVFEKELN